VIVELQGTWTDNAGALLMLDAAVDELRRRLPDAQLVMDPRWDRFRGRVGRGLAPVFPTRARAPRLLRNVTAGIDRLTGGRTRRLREGYGLVDARSVDALVDISGFAIGDQWGAKRGADRVAPAVELRERGGPSVFLPQAFGPFREPGMAAVGRSLLASASLVGVRDDRSMAALAELAQPGARLRRAPDITVAVRPPVPEDPTPGVLLVPNRKVVEHGSVDEAGYVEVLGVAAEAATAAGRTVGVLLHGDEPGDRALGEQLVRRLGAGTPVLGGRPAVELKGHLARADLVVGSRFHALLGAAAEGTPFVSIGWSHKYGELAADFGLPAESVPAVEPAAVRAAVGELLDPERRAVLGAELLRRGDEQRAALDGFWAEAAAALGGDPLSP
jgi:colanic acid/amylovoran biosynthesis protein